MASFLEKNNAGCSKTYVKKWGQEMREERNAVLIEKSIKQRSDNGIESICGDESVEEVTFWVCRAYVGRKAQGKPGGEYPCSSHTHLKNPQEDRQRRVGKEKGTPGRRYVNHRHYSEVRRGPTPSGPNFYGEGNRVPGSAETNMNQSLTR